MSNVPDPASNTNQKLLALAKDDAAKVSVLQKAVDDRVDSIFEGHDLSEFSTQELFQWLAVLPKCRWRTLMYEKVIYRNCPNAETF